MSGQWHATPPFRGPSACHPRTDHLARTQSAQDSPKLLAGWSRGTPGPLEERRVLELAIAGERSSRVDSLAGPDVVRPDPPGARTEQRVFGETGTTRVPRFKPWFSGITVSRAQDTGVIVLVGIGEKAPTHDLADEAFLADREAGSNAA